MKVSYVFASILAAVLTVTSGGAASAVDSLPATCAPKEPAYTFSSVVSSRRPTNLVSGYITGPGSLTYSKTSTATVGASMTASVSAEAGVVFAKASSSLGVGVTASRSWTDGFSYTLIVPAGKKRRMRLLQESRSFYVTKKIFDEGTCRYRVLYSDNHVNAPRKARADSWVLEA